MYFTINYVQKQLFSTGCNYITLSLHSSVLHLSSVYFCVYKGSQIIKVQLFNDVHFFYIRKNIICRLGYNGTTHLSLVKGSILGVRSIHYFLVSTPRAPS
jgi:hypothetical protein